MIFIIANVLNSAHSDSILFCELISSGPRSVHLFSLAKMASEEQKPLAKMDFFTSLWLVGYR